MRSYTGGIVLIVSLAGALGCEFPRPPRLNGGDGGIAGAVCTANQALRCDGTSLVRCNGEGTAEVSAACALGCSAADVRCYDVNPSNGLAPYLDMAASEPDIDLGTSATIDTDTGAVMADGKQVVVKSATVAQGAAPMIRVFIVRSLTTMDVGITGKNAFAVVSHGDIKIGGLFSVSASNNTPGPGGFNDGSCKGADLVLVENNLSGAGGGGFGSLGGNGGTGSNFRGTAIGGRGGRVTGNPSLVPLRGGCDGGLIGGSAFGAGGGAVQLVSRTQLSISGGLTANGTSLGGGGSGGGILLEAPIVLLSGNAVANGGAGPGGCGFIPIRGEDGRIDAVPATGGVGCSDLGGNGGNGAAGNISPSPSTGSVAVR
jgi:hypothetical protein